MRPSTTLRAIRNDRLSVSVSFDLERRVLNQYPRRELPVTLQSTAYTWSQVRGFRRLYAQMRQEQPRGSSRSERTAAQNRRGPSAWQLYWTRTVNRRTHDGLAQASGARRHAGSPIAVSSVSPGLLAW